LIAGEQRGFSWTACLLAACLVDRDPCKGISSADISERIKLLENHNNQKTQKTAKSDRQLCQRLLQLAEQWYRLLAGNKQKKVNYLELGNLLLYAYPDRIALLREGSHHRYRLANGRGAELFPGDYQAGSKMLVTPQVDARQGDGKIFLAAPISIAELQGHHCQLIQEVDEVSWDGTNQKVSCSRELKVDRLVIESKPLTKVDPEKITEVFLTGLRQTGPNCLPWTRDARELQARIGSLCYWQPGQWPDFSDETMLANLEWLEPYCQKMSRLEQLKKLNLKTILLSILPWNQQQKLDLLAPSHLQVPSGSRIRLSYTPGKSPILAVRIQELFGLKETPRLCLEQIPVTLHLLSPANRPVQITSDLHSFWQNSYPEIKKELAGRYPKHYWPNDPFSAVATTRTKKGMNARRK